MTDTKPATVCEYINSFDGPVKEKLTQLYEIIRNSVPDVQEKISYGMPAFEYYGILVYFAGYKRHIGFYPTASGIEKFRDCFGDYKYSKGAVQFPVNKELPEELIKKIIDFRIRENVSRYTVRD